MEQLLQDLYLWYIISHCLAVHAAYLNQLHRTTKSVYNCAVHWTDHMKSSDSSDKKLLCLAAMAVIFCGWNICCCCCWYCRHHRHQNHCHHVIVII